MNRKRTATSATSLSVQENNVMNDFENSKRRKQNERKQVQFSTVFVFSVKSFLKQTCLFGFPSIKMLFSVLKQSVLVLF